MLYITNIKWFRKYYSLQTRSKETKSRNIKYRIFQEWKYYSINKDTTNKSYQIVKYHRNLVIKKRMLKIWSDLYKRRDLTEKQENRFMKLVIFAFNSRFDKTSSTKDSKYGRTEFL